ncbi:MAG: ABC transporter permease [Rhodobacterales bacterium]|jgi:tungstate transport system permease protein|nr:ABC transporter permease [Pseudomonadota bacterium]MDA1287755.1 ABC transporter permease [Pseudomonadota bacterium]NQW12762.1 ABC transporter permease [Rhodobacter sp.]HBN32493.1 ABC transporter permease [Paracoccaceae bacterium]
METLQHAAELMTGRDSALMQIVGLSLYVSLTACFLAALIGIPLGAALAIWNFPLRSVLVVLSSSLMALPPVVVGLCVYLLLSRAGPLGDLGLLFTPGAMIIAQTILITPIILALTREAVLPLRRDYDALLLSVDAGPGLKLTTLIWDARYGVMTALLAGFGRALAEVGAVLIVGGNISGLTRVMTTTIALETSKGNLELALALGLVLLSIAIAVNASVHLLARLGRRYEVTR